MDRIIVSMTSYPARIENIKNTLHSIMSQTCKPDKVVLYLSEEQFAGKNLQIDLSDYFSQGLEIHWCLGDMKSHKKYLYAFREYADDYIITIDDDFYYEKHMVEELVQYVSQFPGCILGRRTHLITAEREGCISPYEKWWGECMHYVGMPRMDLFAVGCGGILYPPHLLTDEVFNTDNIMECCMYADDVWLKVMELISGVPVVQVQTRLLDRYDEAFAIDGLYQKHNGNGGNDRSLQQLLVKYDHFDDMKESLIEKIFSTGKVYEDEIDEGKKRDDIRMSKECIDSIEQNLDIVIYGAGAVAKRIYNVLKQFKKADKIRSFAVKDIGENILDIEGIKVIQYENVDYKNAVCIIAIADLEEQHRICRKLLAIGWKEKQILFINHRVRIGLQEIIWEQAGIH